jgi:hypothetical protein
VRVEYEVSEYREVSLSEQAILERIQQLERQLGLVHLPAADGADDETVRRLPDA